MAVINKLFKKFFVLLLFINTILGVSSADDKPKYKVDQTYNASITESIPKRYPGLVILSDQEASSIQENGAIKQSVILDNAFSLLEQGNPFLVRYNLITGSNIHPLLKSGVPYFFGGRSMKNVLSRSPEYRTWIEWQDSTYYHKGMRYFMGLDCRGFLQYVWEKSGIKPYGISLNKFKDTPEKKFMSGANVLGIHWTDLPSVLQIGDVFALYHPGSHLVLYIGTLSDYGYTEDDFPSDPSILEYPLVIHCGVNALYADWFYKIKKDNAKKYKRTSVPDGGVSVSILGYKNSGLINSVYQQKQNTSWVLLPDNSWLTIVSMEDVQEWAWYR